METASENNDFNQILLDAKNLYNAKERLYCPYFKEKIQLTADGFNHLQYKQNREPRNNKEQMLKLRLLKKALETIPNIGTLQEYRLSVEKIGRKSNSFYKTKLVEYWGFHAILHGNKQKIKIIMKRIGDGNIIFWSVMPFNKRLYSEDVYDD